MAAEKKIRSEDELGSKWDRCLSDTSIKIGLSTRVTGKLWECHLRIFPKNGGSRPNC